MGVGTGTSPTGVGVGTDPPTGVGIGTGPTGVGVGIGTGPTGVGTIDPQAVTFTQSDSRSFQTLVGSTITEIVFMVRGVVTGNR